MAGPISAASGRHPGWPSRLGPLEVSGRTVALRPPKLFDARRWSRIRLRDQDHLERWEPSAPGTWAERNAALSWPPQWSGLRSLARSGQTLPYVLTVDGELAGQVTVGNVVRGALCSAWIGYWVASDVAGAGIATAAVALVADHSFGSAGLHRLEATVRPENAASLRVLRKLGFRQEGVFERYLDVEGEWRDHLCFALTAEEATTGVVNGLLRAGRAKLT